MENDVLKQAKKYHKAHEWEKAITYFECYMNQTGQKDAAVYSSYAKSLRHTGRIQQAKEVLKEGKTLFPNNERILQELHALYKISGAWQEAAAIVEMLIALHPQKANYYFQLGRAYAFLKDDTHAKHAFQSGLEHTHHMSTEQVIEQTKRRLTTKPRAFSSEYVYINGKNNYGAFIHHAANKKYVTKITKNNNVAKREATFYRYICSLFPQLKEVVPTYIDSMEMDHVSYLTMEWMEGTQVTSKKIQELMHIAQQIASVPYQDIAPVCANPAYSFQFKNRPTFIIQFFTQIHERYYNEKLFSELYKLIEQNRYPESVRKVIRRLETQIMDNQLYVFINPLEHYSLLHGDFHPGNIKETQQYESLKVFDWASFTIGPHFIDIARLLSKELYPYKDIQAIYLNKKQFGENLTLIEKIFFLYALILLYLMRLKAKQAEKHMDDCIMPALQDMEKLVARFKENAYTSLISLGEEKRKNEHTVRRLEDKSSRIMKENKTLKKQNQHLQHIHTTMINSRSWRLTAPLRKLMGRMKNRQHNNHS